MTTTTDPTYREVSSAENPALVAQLAAEAFDSATDVPELPETSGELPGGYRTPSGNLVRDFEIRELTGISEERMAKVVSSRATNVSNYAQVCRVILEEGLVSIGGYKPDDRMLSTLLLGDRDFLLLKIRTVTYGSDYPSRVICPQCQKGQDVVFELDTDIKYLPAKSTAADFSIDLRNGRKATVRLPNAEDQSMTLRDATLTTSERNTVLLSRCVLSLDGNPLINLDVARNLKAGDRKIIMEFLADHRFGPQLEEVLAVCSYCKEESELSMSMTALFL